MAAIRTGPIVADIRGKVGSSVFSRNSSGAFVRDVGTWTQPDTQAQLDARTVITDLSAAWGTTLTEAQRRAWRQYAAHHPRPNRWGQPTNTSGYNRFIRINAYEYRDDQTIHYPNAPAGPPIHQPTFTFTIQAAQALAVTGNPNPDVTGTYYLDGSLNGWPRWKHETLGWYFWHRPTGNYWNLVKNRTTQVADLFYRASGLLGSYTPWPPQTGNPVAAYSAAQSGATIALPPDSYASPTAGLKLFAFGGAPRSAGVSFFNGPWRLIGTNTFSTVWEHTPWTVAHPWTLLAGEKAWLYLVAHDTSDGALSIPWQTSAIAT